MRMPRINFGLWIALGAMIAILSLPMITRAQGTPTGGSTSVGTSNPLTQMDASQAAKNIEEKSLGDPRAEKAYKKLHDENDADKKIKLAKEFINKYPNSYHVEEVYEELVQAYYSKHDLTNFYAAADEGIAKFPDDPTLMAVSGATMARAYDHNDPDADNKLEKAEKYEKQAIELLKTLKTPAGMSEDQFNEYKKKVSATAHSGLGLIYFRKAQFEDSVNELLLATKDTTTPDATDFLVLGGDYQNLNQLKEAADAFNRCAQIPGPLQAGCKQYADETAKQAQETK
jgi:hypothetical protein